MYNIKLIGKDIKKLEYNKNIQKPEKLTIANSLKFDATYNENEKKCFGEVLLKMQDENGGNSFKLDMHLVGIFEYTKDSLTDDDKKDLHAVMYKMIYPLWSSTINSIFLIVGLPPVSLPFIPIKKDNIKVETPKSTPVN